MIFYFIIIPSVLLIINFALSTRRYTGPLSDHFDGRHFKNIHIPAGVITHLHEKVGDELTAFSFFIKNFRPPWVWRELPNPSTIPASRVFGSDIVVTYINHSTVLIQTEGLNIITDPVWSLRASPFLFFGPRRYMNPGVTLDALPPIDFVLLTHNHYDHFDASALRRIVKKHKTKIYTALGNSSLLVKYGIYSGIDMDWGQSRMFSDNVFIDCVPAQHFSARSFTDRDNALWCGFVIRTPHSSIYFAGDTGYGPFVERIKKVYPEGFRLAFLPIGAFKPVSLMSEVHESPADAVRLHRELGVNQSIPIHFGTFNMGCDRQDEPVEKLKEVLALLENKSVKFSILLNSQSIVIT